MKSQTNKTRLSVLFILHLPPPVHGAAMMGKYIRDSKLINDAFDCHYINLTTAQSLKDIGKGGPRKLWKFACLLARIVGEVRRTKPQLVYVTPNACGGAFYKDFIVVQTLKAMGCRIVAHYHNKGVATRQHRCLDNLMYKRFFKGIKVILLAEALYADVQKYVRREDVFICPNGIPETLHAEPPAKRNNRIPRLLFLSNLLVSKGVFVLLDACKLLKERGYSFVCEFVGGETAEIDAARFREEAEKRGLSERVWYRGRKYGEEKRAFLQKADVFVFPTQHEAFGLVNLEAMEYKLPVISTNEGGIPDVVKDGENGLIAQRNDPVSLAADIEKLIGDEDLRIRMGEDGYRKFKQQFTLGAFERKFTDCVTACYGGGKISLACYYGKKYGEEKQAFLRYADIFVFPTFYSNECFPLVLLEAMEEGLPCISTDEGGIAAIIGHGKTGYIVERKNAQQLADKIETLITDPCLCRQMGIEGRQKFLAEFTMERFEFHMKSILEKLVTKSHIKPCFY